MKQDKSFKSIINHYKKSGDLRLIGIECLVLCCMIISYFPLEIYKQKWLIFIFWFGVFILLKSLYGFNNYASNNKRTLLKVTIFAFLFIIIQNILGFYFNFLYATESLLSLRPIGIVIPFLLIIIFQEFSRYIILNKGSNNLISGLLFLIFIVSDYFMCSTFYEIPSGIDLTRMITVFWLPLIIKNALLFYLSSNDGYKPGILYRGIFEIYSYLFPLLTLCDNIVNAFIKIVIPLVLLSSLIKSKTNNNDLFKLKTLSIYLGINVILITCFVSLLSGYFRYHMFIVNKEDSNNIVLIDQLPAKNDNYLIKENDIIAYYYKNHLIIGKVVDVIKINDRYYFRTKENNDEFNNYLVNFEQIIGVVKYNNHFIKPISIMNRGDIHE